MSGNPVSGISDKLVIASHPCTLLLALLLFCSCSSTKWSTENRQLRGDKVAISLYPDLLFYNRAGILSDSAVNHFQQVSLDSLMQSSLSRYVSGMSRGGQINAAYAPLSEDYDIVLYIEELTISRSFSIDFVLRGPVLKTSMVVAGYRGKNRIFETTVSGSQNMAYVARDGRRFYWMQDEDKDNPHFQHTALLDAARTALGIAYMRFFEQ